MILIDLLRGVLEHGKGDSLTELGERLGLVVKPDELVTADGLDRRVVAHPENYPQPGAGVKLAGERFAA